MGAAQSIINADRFELEVPPFSEEFPDFCLAIVALDQEQVDGHVIPIDSFERFEFGAWHD